MREHSGAEGKNNNRNPTMKEAERAQGHSGEAIQGEQKHATKGKRKITTRTD